MVKNISLHFSVRTPASEAKIEPNEDPKTAMVVYKKKQNDAMLESNTFMWCDTVCAPDNRLAKLALQAQLLGAVGDLFRSAPAYMCTRSLGLAVVHMLNAYLKQISALSQESVVIHYNMSGQIQENQAITYNLHVKI